MWGTLRRFKLGGRATIISERYAGVMWVVGGDMFQPVGLPQRIHCRACTGFRAYNRGHTFCTSCSIWPASSAASRALGSNTR